MRILSVNNYNYQSKAQNNKQKNVNFGIIVTKTPIVPSLLMAALDMARVDAIERRTYLQNEIDSIRRALEEGRIKDVKEAQERLAGYIKHLDGLDKEDSKTPVGR